MTFYVRLILVFAHVIYRHTICSGSSWRQKLSKKSSRQDTNTLVGYNRQKFFSIGNITHNYVFLPANLAITLMTITLNKYQKSALLLSVGFIITAILWALPGSFFGIEGLSIIEQRVIALFFFAFFLWVTNGIPAWCTSVLVIVLLLLTCSNSALHFMMHPTDTQALGKTIPYRDIMACFADPTLMLFIGGFTLAIAASKTKIDVHLTRILMKPFGRRSTMVLLGFLLITGIFSMFMSNTATAAMMLTFLAPIFKSLPPSESGKAGLALSIPIGANIGGIGTPIGTPPNAIALKYMNDPEGLNLNVGFGEWVGVMMPYTIIMLVISWFLLIKMFPFNERNIDLKIEGRAEKGWKTIVVYITFALTIILWVLDKVTGLNANVVALIPVAIFCVTGIFTKEDLARIDWAVLWMVAGGFALGVALNESGLAKNFIRAIPFDTWSPIAVIIGAGAICWLVSNIISHTATAALMVPILATVATGMGEAIDPVGGVRTLLIGVAFASSLGMILPISTPPNALAYSTGTIKLKQMQIVGLIMGIVGLVIGYAILIGISI